MAKHSDEVRDQAVTIVRAHGLAEAHRQTGIAKSTISGWLTEADKAQAERSGQNTDRATIANVRRWNARRIDLKHRLGDLAERALDEARHQLDQHDARSARDAMTAAAIAIDKAEILSIHADPEDRSADEAIEAKVTAARGRGLTLLPGGGQAKSA